MIHEENLRREPEFDDPDLKFNKLKEHKTVQLLLIFLVFGYLIAFLTLISEILLRKYFKNVCNSNNMVLQIKKKFC